MAETRGYIALSFIQTYGFGLPLAVLNLESGISSYVATEANGRTILGATGLCKWPGGYAALLQHPDDRTGLALFDGGFRQTGYYLLKEVRDGHDLKHSSDVFLAASTGTNRLVEISLHEQLVSERVLETLSPGDRDQVHFNSLCVTSHGLYVSVFTDGRQSPDNMDWYAVRSGAIMDPASRELLAGGLNHPHTLWESAGRLNWIESSTSNVCSIDLKTRQVEKRILDLDGFVRGVALVDDRVFVGVSADRRARKSGQGYHLAPSSRVCRIIEYSDAWRPAREHILHQLGSEIYDLLRLEEAPADQAVLDHSVRHRLGVLEGRLLNAQNEFDTSTLFLDRVFGLRLLFDQDGRGHSDRTCEAILRGERIDDYQVIVRCEVHWFSVLGTRVLFPQRLLADLRNDVGSTSELPDPYIRYCYAMGIYFLNTLANYTQAATYFELAAIVLAERPRFEQFDPQMANDFLLHAAFHRLLANVYDEKIEGAVDSLNQLQGLIRRTEFEKFSGRSEIADRLKTRLAEYRSPELDSVIEAVFSSASMTAPLH